MCGIAGLFHADGNEDAKFTVESMLQAMRSRGPDHLASASVTTPGTHWAIGSVRLSINDASARGFQPFTGQDPKIWAVTNGEIYNWQSLRQTLESDGRVFTSDCDAEIVPHLFEHYGAEFASRINGMFSIAIVDEKNGKLILARDRAGEKPLLYSVLGDKVVFSSDMRAMLASGAVSHTFDRQAIREFLTYRVVPAPNTVLADVKKVQPGTTVTIDLRSCSVESVDRYWTPDFNCKPIENESAAIEELDSCISDSVQLRTRLSEEIKVGGTLSGGIDSSSILAWVRNSVGDREVGAFTAWVEEDSEDVKDIETLCETLNLTPHSVVSNLTDVEMLPAVVANMGEPIGAGLSVPASQCFELAMNEGYRVLLSGEGSDELFAGYSHRLIAEGILQRWDEMDATDRRVALSRWPMLEGQLRRGDFKGKSPLDRYTAWDDDNTYDALLAESLLAPELSRLDPTDRLRYLDDISEGGSHENRILWLELQIRLEGLMLTVVDRTSMAYSIESRAPLLDPSIIDLAFRLPPEMKAKDGMEKYLWRKVMEARGWLPDEITWKKKHPFSGPIPHWMLKLPAELDVLMTKKSLDEFGLFNSEKVASLYSSYREGRLNDNERIKVSDVLFGILILQVWSNIYLNGSSGPTLRSLAGVDAVTAG